MQKLRIEFEDSLKFSLNKLWQWGRAMTWIRKNMADDWHYYAEKAVDEFKTKLVKWKCFLFFYFSFRKNMLDSSNCAPMAKMVEDTLTRYWVLQGDTNDTVVGVYYESVHKELKERKTMELNTVDVVIVEEGDALFNMLNTFQNGNKL